MTSPKGERGEWGSWFEFLFSALGSMVGLGNIWRFPYVCARSGGGAFLIPFFVSMILCGCPLIFLETLYCQYSNLGPGKAWVICPLFKGLGFGMLTMTSVISIYYTMIMAWTLRYLASSFLPNLPWTDCPDNSDVLECSRSLMNTTLLNSTALDTANLVTNISLDKDVYELLSNTSSINVTTQNTSATFKYHSTEEAYWLKDVLNISSGLDQFGSVQWRLLLCLVGAWIVVFLCLIKGIHSMGKVVYVAATLPYIILTCLLIRGLLLPGAGDGLYFYMVPTWSKLGHFDVWRSAATQVFYSMGMGFGLISTLASYNRFNNNCHRDALILPWLDCLTSVFAGLVIFTFIGYMAHTSGKAVADVADEGPGLVFIAYPAALSTLPFPQFWSVIFFIMLFAVGLDSQFMHVQAVCTALADCFPAHLLHRKTTLTAVVCVISCLLGIPFTTQAGFYLLNTVDWYVASFSVMLLVFIEVTVLAWIYGTDRLYDDIEAMVGFEPYGFWKYSWKYITPIFVMVLWLSGLIKFETIGSSKPGYPGWADSLGLFIAVLPILPIPLKMVWTLYGLKGSFPERLKKSLTPSAKWKPAKLPQLDPEEAVDLTRKDSNNFHTV